LDNYRQQSFAPVPAGRLLMLDVLPKEQKQVLVLQALPFPITLSG
jgi:hypothetical protein